MYRPPTGHYLVQSPPTPICAFFGQTQFCTLVTHHGYLGTAFLKCRVWGQGTGCAFRSPASLVFHIRMAYKGQTPNKTVEARELSFLSPCNTKVAGKLNPAVFVAAEACESRKARMTRVLEGSWTHRHSLAGPAAKSCNPRG